MNDNDTSVALGIAALGVAIMAAGVYHFIDKTDHLACHVIIFGGMAAVLVLGGLSYHKWQTSQHPGCPDIYDTPVC